MIGSTNSIWNVNSIHEQIVNYTMLYDSSFNDTYLNQCKEVTGGWVAGQNLSNYSGGAYAMEATGMLCGDNSSGYGSKYLSTINKIDISEYTTVLINADSKYYGSSYTGSTVINFPGESFVPGGALFLNGIYGGTGSNEYFIKTHEKTSTPYSETFTAIRNFNAIDRESHVVVYAYCGAAGYQQLTIKSKYLALFKPDNWTELSNLIEIEATSISDILDNSVTLLSNKEAVEYMIYNCTGNFIANAVVSETFLTALNNSQYKTLIMANEHWSKFLSMVE